jgi:hypothetical protein
MLHLNISKVDYDVTLVAMAAYACFTHMFQVFHRFQIYVANISSRCFKVHRMLHASVRHGTAARRAVGEGNDGGAADADDCGRPCMERGRERG